MRLLLSLIVLTMTAASPAEASYYTTYSDAFQSYVQEGQRFELADGTRLLMDCPGHCTYDWNAEDIVYLAQGTDQTNVEYPFRLYNTRIDDLASMRVKFEEGPLPSESNLRMQSIQGSYITLEDERDFHIYWDDQPFANEWNEGDVLVLGMNKSWNHERWTHILINVRLNNYVRVQPYD